MSELRDNKRYMADFDLLVGWAGAKLHRVKAKNLSKNGMYIMLADNCEPLDSNVDLYFWLNGEVHTINASIIHRGYDGVGVLFEELPPDVHQILWNSVEHTAANS